MIRKTIGAIVVFLCGTFCFAAEQTADLGWCVIHCPQKVGAGEKFTVKITLKEVPEGTKLGGDIHLVKPDGSYQDYGQWGGNPRQAKAGQTIEIPYTMPAPKGGSGGIIIQYFLSPKGWDERVKDGASPAIMLDGDYVDPNARPATATLKKSWLSFGPLRKGAGSSSGEVWTEGDELILPVEYFIDPADDWGGTELLLWVMGPWVDNPDGKYTTSRSHQNYHGLGGNAKCVIGNVATHEFKLKIPRPNTYASAEGGKVGDSLLFIALFKGKDGKTWPWQIRTGGVSYIARRAGFFELDAPTPGNLFTYDQPVVINAILGAKAGSGDKQIKYTVSDTQGKEVYSSTQSFTAQEPGQIVPLPVKVESRGTFIISATVEGWETRETTFATIPDMEKIIGDRPTPFGAQKIAGNLEAVKAARMLGMSTCRVWIGWGAIEPTNGRFNQQYLEHLDKTIEQLNAHNIHPWLLFDHPPAWAIDNPDKWGTSYTPFPFRDNEVSAVLSMLAKRYKNTIIGFEWLNEIVPGDTSPDPVADYLRFCQVSTAAVKAVNPNFRNQLAGGLWPRSFRKALLAAGVADYIEIMPVHYSARTGYEEALRDLRSVGADMVEVWDNETAAGWSTWKMPLREAVADTRQSDYFMRRFPGLLQGGCPQIVLFGGEPEPAGNWSHFWGDMSPRPAAATLAVLVSKLALAKPLGEFTIGGNDSFKLFATADGKPVLVASSISDRDKVFLPIGKTPLIRTDQQGNEFPVVVRDGVAEVSLNPRPFFLEGGDMDSIRAQLAVRFTDGAEGVPLFSFVKGGQARIAMRVSNFYQTPLKYVLSARLPAGFTAGQKVLLDLQPGEESLAMLEFPIGSAPTGLHEAAIEAEFTGKELPVVLKRFRLSIVDPDRLGNLLRNPDFAEAGGSPEQAAHWSGSGKNGQRVEYREPGELGHGGYAYRFQDTANNYRSINQNIANPDGGSYVYSFWIKSKDLQTGSNFSFTDKDGRNHTRSWMQVFTSPHTQEHWDVFYARMEVPEGARSLNCAPVCKGTGASFIDNARLARYEGTDYTASVPRAPGKIIIDGDISEFDRSSPIPLLGKSQLRALTKDYRWTPANLSGVAYLNWDENYLYLAVEVIDDKMVAAQKEGRCNEDDSVEIALHPHNRQAGEDEKAFAYYLSATNPGGSGKHTIYRPVGKNGGLEAGSLAKDSSVYDIAVKRGGNRTVYEVAIPLRDTGGITGIVGSKFGLSFALNDNDGSGRIAQMLWGEGLYPAWSPRNFGMATLIGGK